MRKDTLNEVININICHGNMQDLLHDTYLYMKSIILKKKKNNKNSYHFIMSNAIVTNNFTIFLQTIDVVNSY